MASTETGSGCYTECLASILEQMCRKSPYSKAIQLLNVEHSNKSEMQSFTCQVVSILKGRIIPYALRRFLWPLALFTVANWTKSEFENGSEIVWDGMKIRQLESLSREIFGIMLASGTSKLRITTPVFSTLDGVINKTVEEAITELRPKFLNQEKQFSRYQEQSVKILNVLYTARQIYDPLYIYWLLPIHFVLTKDHMHALIKHFPKMPPEEHPNPTDEGVQIYSFAMCLSLFIEVINKKYGPYNNPCTINNMIEKVMGKLNHLEFVKHMKSVNQWSSLTNSISMLTANGNDIDPDNITSILICENGCKSEQMGVEEIPYLHQVLTQWISKLFVGYVNTVALLFFWDQLFLNTFNSDVIIEFAQTLLLLLGSNILQMNNNDELENLLRLGPNKLLTLDIIRTWNMIHLNKTIDDKYCELNRIIGSLIPMKQSTQIEETMKPNFYLPEFVIHDIVVTTVMKSKEIIFNNSFRIQLDYIVEDKVKTSFLTETVPSVIFHGRLSNIYESLDQAYYIVTDNDRNDTSGDRKNTDATYYSYPIFNEENSDLRITMLHFNLENPFTFMEQELLTLEHENKRYSPKPTEIGHIRVTMQYKISNPDKEDNSDDWISFGWTQIQCFTEKENSKSATETDTKIYPYNLWAREVINPVEQGLCPEPLPDPTWTLTYLLIPFNHLFYYFFPTSLPQTDKHESPQLLQGSRISLRIYNPKIETVPKAVDKPLIYITRRIQVKEAVHETLADMIDGEYLEDEENEEQDVRVIEEVSPPATPLDDPWVAFKKPAPYERQMKPSSTSETFCIYIDQLRFMPDDSTIFKVTGRLLNTNYDEELIDILSVPEELPNNHENSRSPVFSSNQRLIVNLGKNKNLARNSLLFLRVYTLTLRDLNYVVVGNSLLKIFNSDGLLNIGGHQLRLRCEVPAPVSKNGNEYIYGEKALDNIPYIHCATILVRLLPYTEEPIPAPDYKLRSYHSQESTPTEFEWIVYRQFQTHEKRKIDIRSIVKMILRREKEFEASKDQADFLNPDYLHRYTLKRLSVRRNLTGINIPNQMASIFPFFYRINEGFLLSLKSARGLVANRGDFIFALAKVIRGSETNSLPVNKFYGYGNDDDLLFVKVNTKSYLGNPVWEDEPNLTKPYYDSNALLVIQIFRVPLIFTIGGSINISKTDNWFTAQLASDMKSKRRSSKLRKTHLIGWSFVRLFEWGFLRNGTHELCVLKPPIRSRTLSKIQNDDGKAAALWRTDSLLQNTVLTIHLQNARFLDYVEERKPEPQPNYSQLQTDQLEKINEFNESDEKVKQLNEINLDSMVKHRAKNDVNWLEDNQDAAEKLLTEIHELLKTQVEDCPSKQEYMPLFVTRL